MQYEICPCCGKPKKPKDIANGQRWPPNFLLSHSEQCTPLACADECAVRLLDEQAGERKSGIAVHRNGVSCTWGTYGKMPIGAADSGYDDATANVSRFFPVFYAAKASRRERNEGCEALPMAANRINAPRANEGENFSPSLNHHPTVKSLALMRWLVRLITPPGGTVLDCFAGSGSTLVACVAEGFHYIGMEENEAYIKIARARIAHAQPVEAKPKRPKITRLPKPVPAVEQLELFA